MKKIRTVKDIKRFIFSIDNYTDEEIMANFRTITEILCNRYSYELVNFFVVYVIRRIKNYDLKLDLIKRNFFYWWSDEQFPRHWIHVMMSISNLPEDVQMDFLKKLMFNLNFEEMNESLDMPQDLKFGLEIEYCQLSFEQLKYMFESKSIKQIFEAINVPDKITEEILNNYTFTKEKIGEYESWIFSPERPDDPEVSTPILTNKIDSLNQLKAVFMMFKALKANVNGGSGLHINIGTDYFKGNLDALKYLLLIWSECEEIFYKIANEEGDRIRCVASSMAIPIKGCIQKTFEENPDFSLDTWDDIEEFIYNVQVRGKLRDILNERRFYKLKYELDDVTTEEERRMIFKRYLKEKTKYDTSERFVSANFNHLNWGKTYSDRIEFRLFNSTLNFETLIENLLLVSKLFETSLRLGNNDKDKLKKFSSLLRRNVTEGAKLELLLDLLFDNEQEKEIYRRRWESVKDNSYYHCFYTGKETHKLPKSLREVRRRFKI